MQQRRLPVWWQQQRQSTSTAIFCSRRAATAWQPKQWNGVAHVEARHFNPALQIQALPKNKTRPCFRVDWSATPPFFSPRRPSPPARQRPKVILSSAGNSCSIQYASLAHKQCKQGWQSPQYGSSAGFTRALCSVDWRQGNVGCDSTRPIHTMCMPCLWRGPLLHPRS